MQKALSYQYDALNRLAKIINPDSTFAQFDYDLFENKTTAKDPKGNTTSYSYDALKRQTAVVQPGSVTTAYEYNSNSRLIKVTDANNHATIYKLDDAGRTYQVISPDTGTTTYSYDAAGNLASKIDAKGTTINYTYDAASRLTNIDFPTDTDVVYVYDNCLNGKGRLCSMTDAASTTSYEYSPKGQTTKETKVIDGATYITRYTYDMNRNTRTITYPSGRVITYTLSNDKAVTVLSNAVNLATSITYKPFGGTTSLTYGNGLTESIGYDNQYRISSIQVPGILNLAYGSYDSNGNITGITNTLDPTKNKTFTYDNLDRLLTATASGIWGSLSWTYDGVGNRQTENSNVYTYTSNSNKLSSANGYAYSYDNNGNTTAEGARTFVYNDNQRLIRVTDSGITKGDYVYNGNGQRVKKIVSGVTTIFHYNRDGQIIAECDGAGATTIEYVYLNSQPLAKITSSGINYVHNDHLGSPAVMTDATGAKIWEIVAKPFGDNATITGTAALNLRFPGQYYDAETGLHYNLNRDYNPRVGGYIESDPTGIARGENHLFLYARANPILFIDPRGLLVKLCTRDLDFCDPSSPRCVASTGVKPILHHAFISVNGETFGLTTKNASITRGCGFEGPGYVAHNLGVDGAAEIEGYMHGKCQQVECKDEQNLLNHLRSDPAPYYCLKPGGNGTNCQGWASAMIKKYCGCKK